MCWSNALMFGHLCCIGKYPTLIISGVHAPGCCFILLGQDYWTSSNHQNSIIVVPRYSPIWLSLLRLSGDISALQITVSFRRITSGQASVRWGPDVQKLSGRNPRGQVAHRRTMTTGWQYRELQSVLSNSNIDFDITEILELDTQTPSFTLQ